MDDKTDFCTCKAVFQIEKTSTFDITRKTIQAKTFCTNNQFFGRSPTRPSRIFVLDEGNIESLLEMF